MKRIRKRGRLNRKEYDGETRDRMGRRCEWREWAVTYCLSESSGIFAIRSISGTAQGDEDDGTFGVSSVDGVYLGCVIQSL